MTKRIVEMTSIELTIFRFNKWTILNSIRYHDLIICPNLAFIKNEFTNCPFCGIDKGLMYVVKVKSIDVYEIFCYKCLNIITDYRPLFFI